MEGVQRREAENTCLQYKNSEWQEFKIKTLGVWLSIEPELTMNLNLKGKREKKSITYLKADRIKD